MKTGIELIAAERERQITAEGWDTSHDDSHDEGQLAHAAECYLDPPDHDGTPLMWPWEPEAWNPTDRVRDLVKAGALIAAEIDRLQRSTDEMVILGGKTYTREEYRALPKSPQGRRIAREDTDHEEALKIAAADPAFAAAAKQISDGIADRVDAHRAKDGGDWGHPLAPGYLPQNARPLATGERAADRSQES